MLSHSENWANNGAYLARLVNDHGVEVKAFNEDVWDAFGEAAEEVFEEVRDHSALAAKIDDGFQSFLRETGTAIQAFQGTFLTQRNRVLGLG